MSIAYTHMLLTPSKRKLTECSPEETRLYQDEQDCRQRAATNSVALVPINFASALLIFVKYIVSLEMLASMALCVGLTVYVYERILRTNNRIDGSVMDFVLLSFAVITPLSSTINMAFKRRERALDAIASLRAVMFELYIAHANWEWGRTPGVWNESGRTKSTVDWMHHTDLVMEQLLGIGHDFTRYLTLPSSTGARHKSMTCYLDEVRRTQSVGAELYKSILVRCAHISDYCEVLKREGFPPNEATRVRQWEQIMLDSIERIKVVKMYRTPQGLRSFGRLFSMILPAFYCPFYAEMAVKLESLPMGLCFALLTSMALTGLFETVAQVEDPFVASSVLDGIQVCRELVDDLVPQMQALRKYYFPHAVDKLDILDIGDIEEVDEEEEEEKA
jgi:hypothetical protein